jgi:hypothetical protein
VESWRTSRAQQGEQQPGAGYHASEQNRPIDAR